MPCLMGDDALPERDYVALYIALCQCAGPQPSRNDPKLDLHAPDCRYRREVEGDVEESR